MSIKLHPENFLQDISYNYWEENQNSYDINKTQTDKNGWGFSSRHLFNENRSAIFVTMTRVGMSVTVIHHYMEAWCHPKLALDYLYQVPCIEIRLFQYIGWKKICRQRNNSLTHKKHSVIATSKVKKSFSLSVFFFFLIARLWGEYCLSTCKHVLPLDSAETFSRFWWWKTFDLEYVNSRLQDGFLYVWYSVEFLAFFIAISEDRMPNSVES